MARLGPNIQGKDIMDFLFNSIHLLYKFYSFSFWWFNFVMIFVDIYLSKGKDLS